MTPSVECYYTKAVEPIEEAPLLIEPKCTEPYYSKLVLTIEKKGGPPLLIAAKCTVTYYSKPV